MVAGVADWRNHEVGVVAEVNVLGRVHTRRLMVNVVAVGVRRMRRTVRLGKRDRGWSRRVVLVGRLVRVR